MLSTRIFLVGRFPTTVIRQKIRRRPHHGGAHCFNWKDLTSRFQARTFSITTVCYTKFMKVVVLGAATKTGNCLCLFLKQSPLIDELAIYDTKCVQGLGLELSFVDTRCKVTALGSTEECLAKTLQDAKIVMMVASRGPDDQQYYALKENADIVSYFLPSIIRHCPRAMIAISMSPINSLLPLATEMYKKAGIYEYRRLFGVTTLDIVRANTFASKVMNVSPECVSVSVIGGSCRKTRVPIFSHAKPCNKFTPEETRKLTKEVKSADEEILRTTHGRESPWIAEAFAAARFCISLCKAVRQQPGVIECAYVRSCMLPEVTYAAGPLELGPDGIQRHLGVPPLTDYECILLSEAIPVLKEAIKNGEEIVLGPTTPSSEVCPDVDDKCTRALKPSLLRQSSMSQDEEKPA